MIKILVVDDLQSKREKIVKTILDNHDILEKNIIQAKCVNEAKKILYLEYFDLMILDLVLPVEEGVYRDWETKILIKIGRAHV